MKGNVAMTISLELQLEAPEIPTRVLEFMAEPPVRSKEERPAYYELMTAIARLYGPRDLNEWFLVAEQTAAIWRGNALSKHEVNLLKLSEQVVQDERVGTRRQELMVAQLQADRAAGLPDQVPKVPEVPRTREPMDDTRGLVRCLPALERLARLSDSYRSQRTAVPREIADYRQLMARLRAGDIRIEGKITASGTKPIADDAEIADEEEVTDTPSLVPSDRKP
jgi:hypothetical protein